MPNYKLPAVFLSFAAVSALSAPAATRYVNNDSIANSTCPSSYTTIQSAVTASAAGDTVIVCNGIYNEQVTISIPITLSGQSGAELQPVDMVTNATETADGSGIDAVLVVANTTGVVINDLIIDGTYNGINACAPDLVGILVQNATATIANSSVRYIELPQSLFGCQIGLAIYAESATGSTTNVTITDTTVHDFQKNGITIDETGTNATIKNSFVTGVGPTALIAQNGIQIAYGATATITANVVSGNVYSPCTDTATCPATAEDIIVYQSSGVTISNNDLGLSQTAVDIDFESNNCTVTANRISNTLVYDGIFFYGNNNSATSNVITNSGESAVDIYGSGSEIKTNTFVETPVGILNVSGSALTETGNKFYAIPMTLENQATQAPATARVLSKASPKR